MFITSATNLFQNFISPQSIKNNQLDRPKHQLQNVKSNCRQRLICFDILPKLWFVCAFNTFHLFLNIILIGTSAPECFNFMPLDDSTRKTDHKTGKYKYDNNLKYGWYRFITGYQMPSRSSSSSSSYCNSYGNCDTAYQGVLVGSHPSSMSSGRAYLKVCFGYSGNCCSSSYSTYIYVRNCGSFYVYKLRPTCSSCRYCTLY